MDFQSRLNQFRQGLQDQQDTFNKMAGNMAEAGRAFLPDKVAQHLEYTEKIGGSIVGVGAGIQSGKKIAQRILKARRAKQARNNARPNEDTQARGGRQTDIERQGETAEGQAQREQATRTTRQTDPIAQEEADPFSGVREPGSLGDAGPRGEVMEQVGPRNPLREAGEEDEPEGLSLEDIRNLTQEPDQSGLRAQAELIGGDESGVGARVGTEAEPPRPAPRQAPQTAEAEGQQAGETEQALTDTRTIAQRQSDLSEGARAFEGQARAVNTEEDTTDIVDRVVGGGVKKAATGLAERVLGEGVGEAVSSAVPFVGELVGLGMLIHGIVKAHKNEENGGGPKLSAPNPEATEQAGGFSSELVKGGSGAPTMV